MVDRLSKTIYFFLEFFLYFFAGNSEANARRIANVEAGFGSSGTPLQIPGRVLVGEGVLVKMCR